MDVWGWEYGIVVKSPEGYRLVTSERKEISVVVQDFTGYSDVKPLLSYLSRYGWECFSVIIDDLIIANVNQKIYYVKRKIALEEIPK